MTTSTRSEPPATAFAGVVLEGRAEALARLDELTGSTVALIGDPRLVVRTVAPLADRAARLEVFQRHGVWVLPRVRAAAPLDPLLRRVVPHGARVEAIERVAGRHRDLHVRDGWTRRQLTPRHRPAPDTVVHSNGYYRALRRPHVHLVTWPVASIVADGIRTADGLERHVDVIVRV